MCFLRILISISGRDPLSDHVPYTTELSALTTMPIVVIFLTEMTGKISIIEVLVYVLVYGALDD
jgi:hypothetical protein